ncbi:hypothetical protein HDV57DRAFT_102617 [Trichoderma longibrachiatum]|uniref:Uncharacterized protein n=1 Tax=Trichoderma longibrachiatum ATCC 18648 TaxID=983965 RepID=A0A2T4BSN0_TRILO|nr:hypothetical protein M440DRAFT_164661 [Trichoderma longibrachiatum ATCC 18648]
MCQPHGPTTSCSFHSYCFASPPFDPQHSSSGLLHYMYRVGLTFFNPDGTAICDDTISNTHRRQHPHSIAAHNKTLKSVPSRSHRRDSTTHSLPCPQATRRNFNSTRTRQQTREQTQQRHAASISPIDIHAHASQATFSPASLPCVGPHSSAQAPSPNQSARHTICDRHTARRDPFSSSRRAFLHSAPGGQDGSDPCAIARGSARGGLSLADAVFVYLLLDRSWPCRRRMSPLLRGHLCLCL